MIIVVVTAALFSIGLYGVLTRRDVIAVLASVEVMIGAAMVLLVAIGAHASRAAGGFTQAVAVLVLVLTACEAAVGLALLVFAARRIGTTRIDEMAEVKG